MCCLDSQLRYIHINEKLAGMNGIAWDAHLGRTLTEVIPHVAASVNPVLEHVLRTGAAVVRGTVVAPVPGSAGQPRTFRHSYFPNRLNGAVIGVSCFVEDITVQQTALQGDSPTQHVRATIREIENVMARAAIVIGDLRDGLPSEGVLGPFEPTRGIEEWAGKLSLADLREIERTVILHALEDADWKVSGEGGAAVRLGVPPTTLRSKMKRHKLER